MAQYDLDAARIARQRAIAQALSASGNQGFDPAASAGRMVYARSPWEDINKVAQSGLGAYLASSADKKAGELDARKTADLESQQNTLLDQVAGTQNLQTAPSQDPAIAPIGMNPQVKNPLTGQDENMMQPGTPGTVDANPKRSQLAALLKGADPQAAVDLLRNQALSKAMPAQKIKEYDTGDSILVMDENTGQVIRQIKKGNTPDSLLGADTARRGQDISAGTAAGAQAVSRRGQDISASTAAADRASREGVAAADRASRGIIESEKLAVEKAKTGTGKPLTEFQAKAVGQLSRMEAAESILDQKYQPGVYSNAASQVPGVGSKLVFDDYLMYQQSARQWISGLLRLDSGAAVPETEFDRYFVTYFAQPGDGPDVLEQKRVQREAATNALRYSLNDVQDRLPPKPGVAPAQDAAPAAASPDGGPMSLDDYLNSRGF